MKSLILVLALVASPVAVAQPQTDPVTITVDQIIADAAQDDDATAGPLNKLGVKDAMMAKPKQPEPPTHCSLRGCWDEVGPRPF